jgi:hypothetical protein
VTVGLAVGEGVTDGGGLNFGPGQPARRIQRQTVRALPRNLPVLQRSKALTLPPFEDEDDDEDESKLLPRWPPNRMDLLLMD